MTRDEEAEEIARIRALRDDVDHRPDVGIPAPSVCQCATCRIRRSISDATRDAEDAELMLNPPSFAEFDVGPLVDRMEGIMKDHGLLPPDAKIAKPDDKGTNPKDLIGATKAPLGVVPWGAVVQVAPVFAAGAKKYGPFNWREYKVQRMTYIEAALRHLFADIDGQTLDPETGLAHLAHAVAGLMILLDAMAMGMAVDNRPIEGLAAELIALQTKKP